MEITKIELFLRRMKNVADHSFLFAAARMLVVEPPSVEVDSAPIDEEIAMLIRRMVDTIGEDG
ncbi:MAG: hypothetical protein WC052_05770 [Patescibacteria group bacterium]